MKIHPRGLAAFAAFLVVLMLAADTRLGIVAAGAWLIVEALLWSGVAGFGRSEKP
jgi:hypothetical protein